MTKSGRQLEISVRPGVTLVTRPVEIFLALLVFIAVTICICPANLSSTESQQEVVSIDEEDLNANVDEDIRIISRTRTTDRNRLPGSRARIFTKRKVFSKDSDLPPRINGSRSTTGSVAVDVGTELPRPHGSTRSETFPSYQGQSQVENTFLGCEASPWGGFEPGSWRRTRTTATTHDGNKTMRSVTETKTTLLRFEENCIVLKREKTIKMGAVNHTTPPEEIRLDFFGSPIQDGQTRQELQPCSVVIARKVLPCQLCQIEKIGDRRQDLTIVWYSPSVAPYLLQKETRSYDLVSGDESKKTLTAFSQTTISRTSAHLLLGAAFSTYRSETVAQKGGFHSRTTTLHSTRIPGHVVKESTSEKNAAGKVLYQSETILLDYFAEKI